jgi:hypothetical protein
MYTKAAAAAREIRRTQVLAHVLAGLTYRAIGQALGCSKSTVGYDVKIVLTRMQEDQDGLGSLFANLELRRLDVALTGIWGKVQAGDLQAIDRLLAIMDRRARFLKLYVPYELRLSDDELTAELQKVLVGLASSEPGAAAVKAAGLVVELGAGPAGDPEPGDSVALSL